jgi:hypothetical protein
MLNGTFYKAYIICWIAACFVALFLAIKDRDTIPLARAEYWRFIFRPWRLMTYAIACFGMVVIAPYTGDPTWDYYDAFFMSTLTYFTSPWVIGALYNAGKGRLKPAHTFIAICIWMFSVSWSYDLYHVFRYGRYPETWFSNIFASSVLYISAGLFWSLDWIEGRGVTFVFLENNWPYCMSESPFSKVVWYALLFMTLVSFLILYFFLFKAGA